MGALCGGFHASALGFRTLTLLQVTGAAREGDTIKLTVEPAKGGDSETLEADVVLVSAGIGPQLVSAACSYIHPCVLPALC